MASSFGDYTARFNVDYSQLESALPRMVQLVREAVAQIRADVASGALSAEQGIGATAAVQGRFNEVVGGINPEVGQRLQTAQEALATHGASVADTFAILQNHLQANNNNLSGIFGANSKIATEGQTSLAAVNRQIVQDQRRAGEEALAVQRLNTENLRKQTQAQEQYLTLYHGTTGNAAAEIVRSGNLNVGEGRFAAYATTSPDLALQYAEQRAREAATLEEAAVVKFQVPQSQFPKAATGDYPYGYVARFPEGIQGGKFSEVQLDYNAATEKLTIETEKQALAAQKAQTSGERLAQAETQAAEGITLYHGTHTLLERPSPDFKSNSANELGPGFYASENPYIANQYAIGYGRLNPGIYKTTLPDTAKILDLSQQLPTEVYTLLERATANLQLTKPFAQFSPESAYRLAITRGTPEEQRSIIESLQGLGYAGVKADYYGKGAQYNIFDAAKTLLSPGQVQNDRIAAERQAATAAVESAKAEEQVASSAKTLAALKKKRAEQEAAEGGGEGGGTGGGGKGGGGKGGGNFTEPPGPGDVDPVKAAIQARIEAAAFNRKVTAGLLEPTDTLGETNNIVKDSAQASANTQRLNAAITARTNAELIAYTGILADAQISTERLNAAVRSQTAGALAADEQYKKNTAIANTDTTRTNAEITQKTNERLLQYANVLAAAQVSTQELNAAVKKQTAEALQASESYKANTVGGNVATQRTNAEVTQRTNEQLLQYANELAQAKLSTQALNTATKLAEQALLIDTRETVTRQQRLPSGRFGEHYEVPNPNLGQPTAQGAQVFGQNAEVALNAQRIKTQEELARYAAITQQDIEQTTLLAAAKKDYQARLNAEAASSIENISAEAKLSTSKTELSDRIRIATIAQQTGLDLTQELNAVQGNALKTTSLRALAEKAYAEELNVSKQQLVEGSPQLQQFFSSGTSFQQLMASLRSRLTGTPVAASDQPTLGQYFGQSFLRVASYATAGSGIFLAQAGVRTLLQNAEQLQVTFSILQQQFNDLGQGAQFGQFKQGILDISTATGTAATDIANVALQLKGFFGDTTQAIQGTTIAIQFAKVTGQSLGETVNALTALAADYGQANQEVGAGVNDASGRLKIFNDVTNVAIGVQERFGIQAKDTASFLGDFAPIAAQYGVSLKEATAIAAVYQQASGRSGTAGAEAFNRILPSIEKAQVQLIQLNDTTLGFGQSFDKALAQGNYGQVIDTLVAKWGTLNKATQNYILSLVGGPRQAQALVTIFDERSKYLQELNTPVSADTGKREKYFNDVANTLQTTLQKLGQSFKEIGLDLFQSGFGTALQDLATVAGTFASALTTILQLFNDLPSPMRTVVEQAVALYAILKGLSLLGGVSALEGVAGGALSRGLGALAPSAILGRGAAAGGETAGTLAALPEGGLLGGIAGGGLAGGLAAVAPIALGVGAAYITSKDINDVKTFIGQQAKASQDVNNQAFRAAASAGANVSPENFPTYLSALQSQTNATPNRIEPFTLFGQQTGISEHNPARVGLQDYIQVQTSQAQAQALIQYYQGLPGGQQQGALNELYQQGLAPTTNVGDKTALSTLQNLAKNGTKDNALAQQTQQAVDYFQARGAAIDAVVKDIEVTNQKDRQNAAKVSQIAGGTKATNLQKLSQNINDVVASYQSGNASINDVLTAYANDLRTYQEIAKYQPDPKITKQIADDQKAIAKYYSDNLIAQHQAIQELYSATHGGKTDYTGQVNADLAALNDVKFTDPKDRQQVLKDLLQAEQGVYQNAIDHATSLSQIIQLESHGVAIPPQAARQIVIQDLNLDVQYQSTIASLKTAGLVPSNITNILVVGAQKLGISVGAYLRQYLETERNALRAQLINETVAAIFSRQAPPDAAALLERIAGINKAFKTINDALANIKAPTTTGPAQDVSAAQQKISDLQGMADAVSGGDAVTVAQDQINAANQLIGAIQRQPDYKGKRHDLAQAQVQLIQGQNALAQAQAGNLQSAEQLFAAQNAGDPLAVARNQLTVAQQELTLARTTQQRYAALTSEVTAEHAIQDALFQIGQARLKLLEAYANKAGDTVQVARLQVAEAYAGILNALAKGSGPGTLAFTEAQTAFVNAETNLQQVLVSQDESRFKLLEARAAQTGNVVEVARLQLAAARADIAAAKAAGAKPGSKELIDLQTAYVQAQTNLQQTILGQEEQHTDDLLHMHKISIAEAINQYKLYLSETKNAQQQEQIRLKIYDLQQQLTQDLQFNLPSDIRLPTLYEARRFNESGGNYDNRTITINLNSNSKIDEGKALKVITDAINSPPRYGIRPRTY